MSIANVEENVLKIDIRKYDFNLPNSTEKLFCNDVIDEVSHLKVDGMLLKITKRTLYNGDILLFLEGEHCVASKIQFATQQIEQKKSFEEKYKQPPYDDRYGENKLTGPSYYINHQSGSMMLSKIYYYKELIEKYEDGESYVIELIKEKNDIEVLGNMISINIEEGHEHFAFTMIISEQQLFCKEENLEEYIDFYFESVFNNSVWCSFFIRPSGTYTKLPYSIEPFTTQGYGFSLHHSSKKELLPFYIKTEERFYYDLIENAILQAYMYQKNEDGVFYSNYTSTWLSKETNIKAPYIDTRLNETFLNMVNDFLVYTPLKEKIKPIRQFIKFLSEYLHAGAKIYSSEQGFLFPDYFKDGDDILLSHASLNHQLAIANFAYKAYCMEKEPAYLEIYNGIVSFIEDTRLDWVSKDNGDLYYGVKKDEEGNYIFFGNDYVYVTLLDLLETQKIYKEINNTYNDTIKFLTMIKLNYLKETENDIIKKEAVAALGEPINYISDSRKLIKEVYGGEDRFINILLSEGYIGEPGKLELSDTEKVYAQLLSYKALQANSEKEKVKEINTRLSDETKRANELLQSLKKRTSNFEYEQKKALKLAEELDEEKNKIKDLQQQLDNSQGELSSVQEELSSVQGKLENVQQQLEKEKDNSSDLLERLKKRTSNFEYEQKKANALMKKCSEYEYKMNLYSHSKWFKMMILSWKIKSKVKYHLKKNIFTAAHWLYIKLLPHPRLKNICTKINSRLRIFKDTQKVISWGNESSRGAKKAIKKNVNVKSAKQLNVAMIVDQFSYNSFKYECNAFPIEPSNWKEIFEREEIDIFFCESAWAGVDPIRRPWRGKIYCSVNFKKENREVLLEILSYCKQKNIPTVFWNKEDPTHYPDRVHDFVNTAIMFDHIFTTDRGCVEKYKKDYGHNSVHLLMFATQPRLFNPIEKFERTKEIIFAGSWYNQHPTRCEEMGGILDNIISSKYELKIYDRHSEANDPNHFFPDRFKQYLNPCLPHDKMEIAYKSSEYALNINTVTDSDTMFARRVFELMSSNTLVLSNYSKGMERLFGDNVVFIDGEKNISLDDANEKRQAALYNVLEHHTYKQRFKQILDDIGFEYMNEIEDVTVVFVINSLEQAERMYSIFEHIEYKYKKAIFYVKETCSKVDFRNILVKYNTNHTTVISQEYCKRYKDTFFIESKYFIVADENLESEFITKALAHFEYIDAEHGVVSCCDKYKYLVDSNNINALFTNKLFQNIKEQINQGTQYDMKKYSI